MQESLGEPAQLLVEFRPELPHCCDCFLRRLGRPWMPPRPTFAQTPPGGIAPRRAATRADDAVEPARERTRAPDRTRLSRQNQEDCLRGVLGVVSIAQNTPADLEHHWPVPFHQDGKRGLGMVCRTVMEPIEQERVGEPGCCPGLEQNGDLAHDA